MLTTKNTGLVDGVPRHGAPVVTVRVLRGFYDERHMIVEPGQLVPATLNFAKYLVNCHKAQIVHVPQAEVVTVEAVEEAPPPQIEAPETIEVRQRRRR